MGEADFLASFRGPHNRGQRVLHRSRRFFLFPVESDFQPLVFPKYGVVTFPTAIRADPRNIPIIQESAWDRSI